MKRGTGQHEGELPIACNLSGPEMAVRRQKLAEGIFGGYRRVEELADGYSFCFPGNAEWAGRLVGFATSERSCCPFLAFELAFEPDLGPIWLKVRGAEGVKEFVKEELAGIRHDRAQLPDDEGG